METYRSVRLVEDNGIGFLVFVGCAIAALTLGAAFRFRDYLEQRSFEKKFENRSKNGRPDINDRLMFIGPMLIGHRRPLRGQAV
jgi:hypothetical protein